MNGFVRLRRQQDQSLAEIGRLLELHRVLRVASDGIRGHLPEQDMRSISDAGLWWQALPRIGPVIVDSEQERTARRLVAEIEDSIESIARRLDRPWSRRRSSEGRTRHEEADDWVWTLGSVDYVLEERLILRGSVELRKTEPVAPKIPDEVVQFLVTVPGTKDKITRESHGHWGYHYHYLDSRNRRSDTLLTFDPRSTDPTNLSPANPNLYWEQHAEGTKEFQARARNWSDRKRQSVYSVCLPDTKKFKLSDFKTPASDAEPVWPVMTMRLVRSSF